jgi:hypothetical protein
MGSQPAAKQPKAEAAPAPPATERPAVGPRPAFGSNQALARLFRTAGAGAPPPSPGLAIAPPDDTAEREADRVAGEVMRTPAGGSSSVVQRKCAGCEDEERNVHRRAAGVRHHAAAPIVNRASKRSNKSITINLAEQTLVARDGDLVVFQLTVVSGAKGTETPLSPPGKPFKISKKEEHWKSREFDGAPMEHSLFFVEERGIAIHESYAVGLRSLARSLGVTAVGSHGCVGLGKEDAKSLFDWAPRGTPVEVISGDPAERSSADVRRSAAGDSPGRAPPLVNQVLARPGRPLAPETRDFFEPRFGLDFSAVRVHDDPAAAT